LIVVLANPSLPTSLHSRLSGIDSLFRVCVKLIRTRGYKDSNLEGSMRAHAHWLEKKGTIASETILTLRRHEKDYIIRNELQYVDKLNQLASELAATLKKNLRDSTRFHLTSYQADFNELVRLDQAIGMKDNSGLKLLLDSNLKTLAREFEHQLAQARVHQQVLFRELTVYYGFITLVLLLLGLIVSYVIAKKITEPLTQLTEYITRFVDSNFTMEDGQPTTRSKDEIGKLTQNFTILKNEVISRLRFFKQKVDERTAELAQANERLIKINEANSRFVPKEFLHFLNKPGIEDIQLGDQSERDMTIMFTDIRSFTKISERLSPQENFDFINCYLKEIVPVIQKHGGFIDKYIGDSVMALFPDSADRALAAALELQEAMERFNHSQEGELVLIGTGIHSGRLILGTIGHEHRMETTVISDAVNIASRVEGLTRHYDCTTIVTKDCFDRVEDPAKFTVRYLGQVVVSGKSTPVEILELLHKNDHQKLSYQTSFQLAVQKFIAGDASTAMAMFHELSQLNPHDGAVKRYLHRCQELQNEGVSADSHSVEIMRSK
jgi:class 3 adenylate cyclase/HAMP domain-containing protein